MTPRFLPLGFALTALLPATLAMAGEHPAIGRWDLTIMVSAAYKAPSWIEIRKEGEKFLARFQGEVSGTHDIGEIKVDGNKIEFKSSAGSNPDCSYTAEVKPNGTISGTRTTLRGPLQGQKHPFIGLKFVPKTAVAGEWKLSLGDDKADLVLKEGKKALTGKMSGKIAGEVAQASVNGRKLALTVKAGEKARKLEAEVRGDQMEGTIEDAEGKPVKFTARRDRKWGEPIKLFNGKNLDGWEFMDPPGEKADNHWTVIDGNMASTRGGKNARTKRADFTDFKLHVEFRVPPKGNSGVYLRGRYEIQVKDSAERPLTADSCGAIYSRITPSVNAAKPAGEWQTFDITLVGQFVTVALNGTTIIDNQELEGITGGAIDADEFGPGPIYLQGDHSKIEYRSIVLTPSK